MLKEILEKLKLVSEDDSGIVLTMEELEVLHENFEQLDELSKKTLGSYIKKASDKVFSVSMGAGHALGGRDYSGDKEGQRKERIYNKGFDKSYKRTNSIKRAADKLTKESVDTEALIASIVNSKPSEFMSGFESVMFDKITDLINGKKDELASTLFKEPEIKESEDIQELSKKTLGSYINKAAGDGIDHAERFGYKTGKKDSIAGSGDGDFKKAFKRITGIKQAVKKLTKEDTE